MIQTGGNALCFWYSFAIAMLCLTNGMLAAVSTALMLGIGLVSPILFYRQIRSNRNVLIGLALPALGFLSAIWSIHPGTTIYYNIQLLITLSIAVTLASFRRLDVSLWGMFFAHLIFATLSLVLGQTVPWENGEYVFVGLSGAKNAYGGMNSAVILLGVYAVHASLKRGWKILLLTGLFALAVGCLGVILSKSAGALVGAVASVGVYVGFAALSSLRANTRAIILVLFAVIVGLVLGLLASEWEYISSSALSYFGKSSDLTGRVDLWFIADRLMIQHYWLGVGQYAFWVQNDPLPEAIWAQFGILSRRGFNFHNTYREIMIHLGMVGLIVHVAIIGLLVGKQFSTVLNRPRKEHFFYFVLLLTTLSRVSIESILPMVPVNQLTIFLFAGLVLRTPEKVDQTMNDQKARPKVDVPS